MRTSAAISAMFSVVLALAASDVACGATAANGKPNVVLILIDDLGWADVGCCAASTSFRPFWRSPASTARRVVSPPLTA